jgi:purine-binding chemotaxis protein CheW
MEFLCFSVKNRRFGIDISNIIEILGPGNHFPDSSGLSAEKVRIKYKDSKIPVIDLRKFLFNTIDSEFDTIRIILSELNGRHTGIIVDAVDEIIRIANDNLTIPDSMPANIAPEAVTGVFRQDEDMIFILSPDQLYKQVPAG